MYKSTSNRYIYMSLYNIYVYVKLSTLDQRPEHQGIGLAREVQET